VFASALGATAATPRQDPRRAQAQRLVAEGRCAAALELLARVTRDHPADVEPLLWTGQCAIEQQRFEEARAALEAASELAPEDGEIRLQLAIALYHEEAFARATTELEAAAQRLGEDRAEIALYRGLLLLADPNVDRAADAASWLERARVLDADAVEPVASYYAGVGWSSADDEDRARAALERVVDEWPGTPWALQAGRMLEGLGAGKRRVWGSLRAGVEYDDNAVLQGQGTPLPSEISSRSDVSGVWTGTLGAELFRHEAWSSGAALSYSGSVHEEIDGFDTQYPSLALWLDRRVGAATTLRGAVDTGYAWVDYEPFLWSYRASLSAIHTWREAGTTEVFARFWRDDYFQTSDDVPDGIGVPGSLCSGGGNPVVSFCGPPGIDEEKERNRDGNGVAAGWVHRAALPLTWPWGPLEARGGYQYEHFASRGTEYSYDSHALAAGLRTPLPWSFILDVSGSFAWRPYRHPTTFPNGTLFFDTEYGLADDDRDETTAIVDLSLERPITRWLLGSVRWHYERNDSNADAFDYRRNIVGGYLTARFGH
jgi:tetratricopeptide (TPR) repeat protein